MARTTELSGRVFGRLTVVKQVADARRGRWWLCICECGNETTAPTNQLQSGGRVSCGCGMAKSKRKHGMSFSAEHRCWSRMKERCYNKNVKRYPHYGGRGITVCDRWLNDFEAFYADMGPRPTPKHSIDRINNDLAYSPENCRWATSVEQNNNRSYNRLLTINGVRMTVAEASVATGVPHATILGRLGRGLSGEEATRAKISL